MIVQYLDTNNVIHNLENVTRIRKNKEKLHIEFRAVNTGKLKFIKITPVQLVAVFYVR